MFSLTDCFRLEPSVRLRPVPEMGVCLAYTPTPPALHTLNAASWLIASLCDGRSLADVAAAYRIAMASEAGSETALLQGITQLLALGILRQSGSGPEPSARISSQEGLP